METPGDSGSETRLKFGMVAVCLLTALAMFLFLIEDEEATKPYFEGTPAGTAGSEPDSKSSLKYRGVSSFEEVAADLAGEKTGLEPVANAVGVDLFARVCARSNGKGIEHARVEAIPLPRSGDAGSIRVTTDPSGQFRIPFAIDKDSSLTNIHVRISADGYRDLETKLVYSTELNVTDHGAFHLLEDEEHAVLVKDGSGKAIPDARLTFFRSLSYDSFIPAFTKTSDENGWVQIKESELDQDDHWRRLVFRTSAKGMADQWFDGIPGPILPDEIIMEPTGPWSCRVIDGATGAGLPGARVSIIDGVGFLGLDADGKRIERITMAADASGNLAITMVFSLHFGAADYYADCTVRADAKGYIPWKGSFDPLGRDPFPREIALRPASFIKTGVVVHARTDEPIPGIPVQLHPHEPAVTDEMGRFSFPVAGMENTRFRFHAPFYRAYDHTFEPNEAWRIRLAPGLAAAYKQEVPVASVRVRTVVSDELGRPVAGAKVGVRTKGEKERDDYFRFMGNAYNHGMDRVTGPDGVALHEDRPLLSNRILRMAVNCGGFVPFHAQFEVGDPDRLVERRVTLERGVLTRNIRVVDLNGDPLEDKNVIAALSLEHGKTFELRATSDELGFCELLVPCFVKGKVSLKGPYGKPEDEKAFVYRDILARNPITLVSGLDFAQSGSITGTVRMPSGDPAAGAVIRPRLTRESMKQFAPGASMGKSRTIISREDGTFEIPVFKDTSYHLDAYLRRGDEFWFLPEDAAPVFEGTDVTITLVKAASVKVDFGLLVDKGMDLEDAEIWLEFEDGDFVKPLSSRKRQASCLFHLATSGRMRAFLKTARGRQYRTPIFTVRPGEGRIIPLGL